MRGEEIPDYANKYTWNILHSNIDSHRQQLIPDYPGGGL